MRVLGFGLALVLLFASTSGAQSDIISEIDVQGNRRIPAETVRARIFTHAGDIYDTAALERDFNSLWNTGYFEDIRFTREQTPKGWRLIVQVKEKPTIREINYVGLSSVSTSDVLDRFKLAKVGLSVESQYDPTKVKKAEVAIKGLLGEHGRQFSTIRTEVRQIPPAAIGLTFVVKEGPKVKVGKIKFEGNKNVPTRTLRYAMKNLRPIGVPHSIFLENIFARTYDATKLDEDTERVRNEYQNRGYFKVIVNQPKTQIHDTGHAGAHIPLLQSKSGKAVDITMPIEEGEKYTLGGITFKNNKAVGNTKALRSIFPIKDGEVFSKEKVGKGLENLRKAYGEQGYINFTSIPETRFDDEKKLIFLDIDVDEGKQFYVRRIEFQGNTTTRDKVIRREVALEEGNIYNSRLWELSLLRLNQLGYFDQLKPDDPNITVRQLDEKNGLVDLMLKVKEKGKNSIGLNGGVSGLEGAFVGINYSTNNFLGLGETLQIQASVGNLARSVRFGFTQPYMFDRPLQFGFNVYFNKTTFDQARQLSIFSGQNLNLPNAVLQNLQNYTQSSAGFTLSLSYPLRRSFKRVGITYSFDRSSLLALSDASKNLFEFLAFRGISGPNALNGIITSKIFPNFSMNTLDSAISPHHGKQITIGAELAGLGGTVRSIRPIIQYKRFVPMQKGRNALGFNVQGSFISGFGGLVAPPFQRAYMGGENDLRGFDIRSVSPVAFLPSVGAITLTNSDGTPVLKDPQNPRAGNVTVPIPIDQITFPGGDLSVVANVEYRITIYGPVALAPFMDIGIDPIVRKSQLQIASQQYQSVIGTPLGCPQLLQTSTANTCSLGSVLTPPPSQDLQVLGSTNWRPRMSTGLELQMFLPVINAPFRIYWAYNPLRLDSLANPPIPITPGMFPQTCNPKTGCQLTAAGAYTYNLARITYSPSFLLREPRKTFRFTVATTF
ncbi:MAG: outer membrane protein insertion porin family [Acidobacteriaceae bacterium]|jgi:outer membrane protein insertion porin family|nr:outer membrane protein insertion porin family [Acidobacteriaceae bacterium]